MPSSDQVQRSLSELLHKVNDRWEFLTAAIGSLNVAVAKVRKAGQ